MIRNILAIVIGILAGGFFNMAMVQVSHLVYPLPTGVDPNDFDAFREHVEANGMPTGSLLMVLFAHVGGSFVSGLVCGLIAKPRWYLAAALMGGFWMAGGITMLTLLPCPTWFAIADTLLYVPCALLGVSIGGAITGGRHETTTQPAT